MLDYGIGRVHRIPPVGLKCLSEKRRREMTALLGGEQGGRPRLLDHPAPGAQGVRRFQAQGLKGLEGPPPGSAFLSP